MVKSFGTGRTNGFFMFMRDKRPKWIADHPGQRASEITKALGAQWRELLEKDRAKYMKQAEEINASSK